MRGFLTLSLATVFGFGIAATDTHAGDQTIADFVSASGGEFDDNPFDYDILLTAVVAADLVGPLANPDANLTLWAPNDFAFKLLANDLGYEGSWMGDEEGVWNFLVDVLTDLGEGDPIPVLTNILLYHVAPERVSAIDFIIRSFRGEEINTLLEGATFRPRFLLLEDNEPDLRNPFLFFPLNVNLTNGYVHTIGRVLIPVDLP